MARQAPSHFSYCRRAGNGKGFKDFAIATVPDEWVDMKSIVGPPERIRERYRAWEDCGADTLNVRSRQPEAIEAMAKAARLN